MTPADIDRIVKTQFGQLQQIVGIMAGMVFIYLAIALAVPLVFKFEEIEFALFVERWQPAVYLAAIAEYFLLLGMNYLALGHSRLAKVDIAVAFQRYTSYSIIRVALCQVPQLAGICLFLFLRSWLDLILLTLLSIFYIVWFFPRFKEFSDRRLHSSRDVGL